jgi:large exoprotein involved in heme utilization and adhesion
MSTGQSLISQGTLASRPATPVAWGSIYFTTDTGQAFYYNGPGATWVPISIYPQAVAFASLPGSPVRGMQYVVTDSNVNTWGTNITSGGGADVVLAWYNGSNWVVIGK